MRICFSKAFLHGGRRGFTQQAEHHDPDATEDKAWNDFVQAQPRELFPDDDRHRTDDHPCQRAVAGHTRPHYREQNHRAKRRAEARPGVGDEGEHEAVGVAGEPDGDDRDEEHHAAAEPDEFALGGVAADERAVEVLGKSRRAHEQLAGERGHDGRENGGH